MIPTQAATTTEILGDLRLEAMGIRLFVKRLDLLDPHINGNKPFKLKYNIEQMQKKGCSTLLTFGGAYSNHLLATAHAGKKMGFKTIGILRGEEFAQRGGPVIDQLRALGMELVAMDRGAYRLKEQAARVQARLQGRDDIYVVPEGGSNDLAVQGCMEILTEDDQAFDKIYCACGTGTTLAGLSIAARDAEVMGVSVLEGGEFLTEAVRAYRAAAGFAPTGNWKVLTQYAFGGYAKHTPELLAFIDQFQTRTNIAIEPVYPGKLFYAVYDQVQRGEVPRGSKVMVVHSGGVWE